MKRHCGRKRRGVFFKAFFALALAAGTLPGTGFGQYSDPVHVPASAQAVDQGDEPQPMDGGIADADDLDQLLNLADQNVDQLTRVQVAAPALQMEVSTVSRQKSTVGRSPAAVFVITQEMIRRSGVTSVPEALRLAPGVQVARIDANKWAISIRGFNGRFANKLLVQIDGRSVYTPLFAGVFWDVQDLVLEDIERIEVIRGPGATVWGANAVNGVINIITKRAVNTQGYYVKAGSGTEERGFASARVGGHISENAHYRVYGKWFERDEAFVAGDLAHDDWRMGRGGFRVDWDPTCCDVMTLQGDAYRGMAGQRNLFPDPVTPPLFARIVDTDFMVAGGNVLYRWTRQPDDETEWSFQTYFDRTERDLVNNSFREDRNTLDFDFQYRFALGSYHSVIWGFGYRYTEDTIRSEPPTIVFAVPQRTDDLFSYFVQDEITLVDDLWFFTIGSKFQHNDYTGFEVQPTARLLWTPTDRHSVWGSISRAVRTPSRAEDDVSIMTLPSVIPPLPPPTFALVSGSRESLSEELIAYEIGFRAQPADHFSYDIAVFLHEYDNLIDTVAGIPFGAGPSFVPLTLTNAVQGHAYGFEVAANYELTPDWNLSGAYSLLRLDLDGNSAEGNSPRNQAYFMSSWNINYGWELDLIGRYADSLPAMAISSYFVGDVRLSRQFTDNLEVELVGRHLLDAQHPEFGFDAFTGNIATEVQSEFLGSVIWRR